MADSRIVTGTAVAGPALVAGPQHGVLCEDLTMSSISSIGSGVSQFLQNLISNNASSSNSSNASSGAITSTTPTHHHHHGGFEKLAGAVVNALQSAASSSNSSSGATADPNQTITAALTKIFQNGSLGGSGDTDSSTGSTSNNAATNNATTGATGSTTTSGIPAAFAQTLQSFGVTAQQFQADLTTALQNAQQSGTANLSTAFKSFPAGSLVDALG